MYELLTPLNCILLFVAAMGIGVSKSGFPGLSMMHVIIFALVFGTKASTGVLLPMLVIGDFLAIYFFGKKTEWVQVRRLLPPAMVGVVVATFFMAQVDESTFKPLVGTIILVLTAIQAVRMWRPGAFEHLPHNKAFVWTLGLLAGITTMLANAAGPVVALYLIAVALPKLELVGTAAWFFLVINLFKLPFSFSLALIDGPSLVIDLLFAPGIWVGILLGRWLVHRLPQKAFDTFLLILTAVTATRLVIDPLVAPAHDQGADISTAPESAQVAK